MNIFSIIKNKGTWDTALGKFNNPDCYYSFEYGSLFAKKENGEIFAAFFEDDGTKIFYPFIKRKVPFVDKEIYDIVTPYGYGGPLVEGMKESILKFYKIFSLYCFEHNIITETIRFHPLYGNAKSFRRILDVDYIRKTTAVDLTAAIEEIRCNYSAMNLRNIKKAKKNNLKCFLAENNQENIKIFIDLYKETMDRNHATSYYYFDEDYFLEQMKETNISKTFLLFTELNNEIIAGVMVLVGKEFSHYHLGASRTKYLDLKPNNLLFDYMIEFCKLKDSKILHLGGGYKENDGLFKFKKSFSNNNIYDYYIGKKIHHPAQYCTIIERLKAQYELNESYFPIYRSQMKKRPLLMTRGENGEKK